jgi:dienelactone hydrolase
MRLVGHSGNLCLLTSRHRALYLGLFFVLALPSPCPSQKRRITVKDTIEMTEFADRGYFLGGAPSSPVAIFSPDGSKFLVRLKKGDVAANAVEYRLLLFETSEVFRFPSGKVLLAMSSSSNREAIQLVRWLDNRTVVFLGENTGVSPQVYRADILTKRVVQVTYHPTAVVSYDISRDGRQIVYEAAPPLKRALATEKVQRYGLAIISEDLSSLLGEGEERDDPRIDRELFLLGPNKKAVRVPSPDFLTEYLPLELSPDGRFAVLAVYVSKIPDQWAQYEDPVLHRYIVDRRKPGTLSNVEQYMLLDVHDGTLRPLLDAPKAWADEGIAWSRDGRSVIVSGTYLPVGSEVPQSAGEQRKHTFVVEVDIASGEIRPIISGRFRISHLDDATKRFTLEPEDASSKEALETFEKTDTRWRLLSTPAGAEKQESPIEITLEEGLNTPPRIFARNPSTGWKKLLLDLNPQFHDFEFAAVKTLTWKATDGHEVSGGLYFPPDFRPGQRYPLVIQTHGFEENRFWMNGPWNSAFAAQPLAAKGMVVLQVGDSTRPGEDRKFANTLEEGPRRMAVFEGAIDELDRRGLIDRERVGIIGFSRTVFHVAFTLTHSKYRFRAATMADGFDGGYLSYLLWRTVDYEGVNGGVPVGAGLKSWFERSPAFVIERVSSPVRIEEYGPDSFLGGWQWFSLLSILGKPVDFVWLPRGTHLLVKPWERLTSQQGNVDWFLFWLGGEQRCDSEDHEACARWRQLAALGGSQRR